MQQEYDATKLGATRRQLCFLRILGLAIPIAADVLDIPRLFYRPADREIDFENRKANVVADQCRYEPGVSGFL